jgi:succinate dehydrogenase / fumarate reductase flavoprotein subunit
MMIYPAVHYTMGGTWVDYNLQTTIPGCFSIGESNFSDHGANRLGASALMQGLADGYFVLPYTIGLFITRHKNGTYLLILQSLRRQKKELKSRLKIHEQQRNTFC